MNTFKVGDLVECIHSIEWQNEHRDLDHEKGLKENCEMFIGNASTYMHTDEAYVITEITKTGGVRLRGFALQVSAKDLKLSTKPNYR